ncbi:hypothetical protein T265_11247 [Opisthorchis viverrini]|uniref:Uncharacterized protein n=1 Tax=Opisthorchis viverrini TaxID=6198 RepID=A0A074YZM4_OPIVI|nr:hypothetical protein T265_11247 [Opisthorchis viverrini]KER20128.1 hypothetical protein T265_11247 [Opisthorchis viverrini]
METKSTRSGIHITTESKKSPKECTSTTSGMSPQARDEDPVSDNKTSVFDSNVVSETSTINRYISKLHCNLDSRYQFTGILAMEFRRPMFSCNAKLFQSFGGRSTLSNCTPNSGVTSEPGELTGPKLTAELRRWNAEAWPNRLTGADQVTIIQNFCTHFYERYCTAFGDLQGTTQVTSYRNENGKEWADNSKVHPAPGDQISTADNTYTQESRGALCPFFFIGSLSDAAKLCERPPGRPWPVMLFYLHHEQSKYTRRFVENVLCSNAEDTEASSCETGNRTPTIPDLLVPGQYSSASTKVGQSESFSQPNVPQSTAQRVVASRLSPQSEFYRGRFGRRRMSENLESGRSNASYPIRSLTRTPRRLTASPEIQVAALKRQFNDQSLRWRSSRKYSTFNDSVGRVGHESCTNGNQSKDKQTNNASRSLLFPRRTTSAEARELSGSELIRREVTTQPERKCEYVCADSEENDQVYETSYRTKSFRTLLLERSAGLVPWDCTTVTARAHLASAFLGTQLAQWLKEWREPNQYPVLVAIGRTAERDVVCSYLSGPKSNRVSALKWLNEVTLAHFSNYLNKTVPLCPERSEPLTGTTTSSAENIQNQIPTHICSYLPRGASFTVSRTTAITGELTEHTFTSLLSTRGPSSDRGALTRSNCAKYNVSPNISEGVIYRVGKTPKQEEVFHRLCKFLSKCTTAKYLHSIGIPVEFLDLRNTVGFRKPLSTQQLTTTLCMVSDPIAESQMMIIPSLEARSRHSHFLMPSMRRDSQTSGRSRIKSITRERRLSSRVSTRSKPRSADPPKCDLHGSLLREDPQFYHEFRRDFVKAFPSSPPFLLGHFQTALMRSFDILSNQQTSPLLMYLHDSHSPGIFHFVANVLCSRRFTSRLFDHNIQLWPLDVSGVADGSYSLLAENRADLINCVRDICIPEQKPSSQTSTGKTKKRSKIRSSSGFATDLLGGSRPSTTARKLKKQGSSEMWMASSNNTHYLSECAAPNSNESTKQTNALASAERLLQLLHGHPAEVPILPTIVNVFYSEKKFSITHILLPSSTTKNALSWLNSVIKFYHRSRSKR